MEVLTGVESFGPGQQCRCGRPRNLKLRWGFGLRPATARLIFHVEKPLDLDAYTTRQGESHG